MNSLRYSELIQLDAKELLTVARKQAERINKQITRAKQAAKAGKIDLGSVLTAQDLQRVSVPYKQRGGKKAPVKLTEKEARKLAYLVTQREAKYEGQRKLTTGNIKKMESEKEMVSRMYFGGAELSAEQYQTFKELEKSATAASNVFYQFIRTAWDRGIYAYGDFPKDKLRNFGPGNEEVQRVQKRILQQDLAGVNNETELMVEMDKYGVDSVDALLERMSEDIKAKNKQRPSDAALARTKDFFGYLQTRSMKSYFESKDGDRYASLNGIKFNF